jgi:hypothetical protein
LQITPVFTLLPGSMGLTRIRRPLKPRSACWSRILNTVSKQLGLVEPLVIVLSVAVISYLGYYNARYARPEWIHQALATFSGAIYFACIILGPLYIYCSAYLHGASLAGRIVVTGLVPFIWMTKDVLVILESHPLIECLYWYFYPLNIWMACLLLIEVGAGTLFARALMKRRGHTIKVITPAPVIAALAGAAIAAGIFAWGQGENIFSIYMHGYRFLFGGGI